MPLISFPYTFYFFSPFSYFFSLLLLFLFRLPLISFLPSCCINNGLISGKVLVYPSSYSHSFVFLLSFTLNKRWKRLYHVSTSIITSLCRLDSFLGVSRQNEGLDFLTKTQPFFVNQITAVPFRNHRFKKARIPYECKGTKSNRIHNF